MKLKILSGILVLAAIIVIITVLTHKKATTVPVQGAEESEQAASEEKAFSADRKETVRDLSMAKAGITVIKVPARKKATVGLEESQAEAKKEKQRLETRRKIHSGSSGGAGALGAQGVSEAEQESSPQASGVSAGITKIGKYPSVEENKEMNAQGIVMY
ncbi:MAG: hypothetical protein ABH865_07025 [Candidatus Omnitrophota bacterium]|nr:hypothetical protein [Candidatus Omnitrophota bacterium]